MKKITLILLFCLFNVLNINAQLPVTDVAANSQLVVLNSQLSAILSTNVETTATNAKSFVESISQGRTIVQQFEQIKNIQKELSTVTNYVQSFNGLKNAFKYSVRSYSLFGNIIKKLKNIKEYDDDKLSKTLDVLNVILEDNSEIIDKVQKLLTSDGIKTDEGTRLMAIESLTKDIKKNYEKINGINNLIDAYFPPLQTIKD